MARENKVKVAVRLNESDFEYLKKFFVTQGYNSGIRKLVSKFVRHLKAAEVERTTFTEDKLPDFELEKQHER